MNLRLTAVELRALDRAAGLSGVSRSDFVRLALEAAIAAPAPTMTAAAAGSVAELLLREAELIEAEHFGPSTDHPGTR